MDKPSKVTTIGVMMLVAGIFSVLLCLSLAAASLLLWFPAYTYGFVAAGFAIWTGARLLGSNARGMGVPKAGPILMIIQIINCDAISLIVGIIALVMLNDPEVRAYLEGHSAPAPGSAGGGYPVGAPAPPPGVPAPIGLGQGSVLRINTSYMALAWLLAFSTPEITINGVMSKRKWGTHMFEVAPGSYHIEISFPYFGIKRDGHAIVDVDVPPSHIVDIKYTKNNPLMGAKGNIVLLGAQPTGAVAPPAQSPPPGWGPPDGGGSPPPSPFDGS